MLNINIELKINFKDLLILLIIVFLVFFLYGLFLISNDFFEGYYYLLLSLVFNMVFISLIVCSYIKENDNPFLIDIEKSIYK